MYLWHETSLSGDEPAEEGEDAGADDAWHEHPGHAVGLPLDRRLRHLGFLHQPTQLGKVEGKRGHTAKERAGRRGVTVNGNAKDALLLHGRQA